MVKVAVLGAAGGIGQPLSLLMKMNPLVSQLNLYDIVNTPGVAADLSHISTPAKVTGFKGDDQLDAALKGIEVVVIPAGVPRKPGMTRDDLFNINAGIVKKLIESCAKNCPKAFILIISNPVNSTVVIASEVLKAHGVYDPKRVFGITTLDLTRASTFVSEIKGLVPHSTTIDVIGGHSGVTIIPLLSQVKGVSFTDDEIKALTNRIQYGGDEVVKAKDGAGSATLSMAFAGAKFANSLLDALSGKKGIVECAYVKSEVAKDFGVDFFSSPVELGLNGVQQIRGYGQLSAFESELLKAAIPELKGNIQKGIDFVSKASA